MIAALRHLTAALLVMAPAMASLHDGSQEGSGATEPVRGGLAGFIDRVKQRVQEAVEAGKEASQEKEQQLRREYDQAVHRPSQR